MLQVSIRGKEYAIAYTERPGPGPTLLFVHGLGGSMDNFRDACKSAALADCRIISYNNPGTGNSAYDKDTPLNIDDLVQCCAGVVDSLNLNNFFLAGASMGGLVTLLYLQRSNNRHIKGYINIEGNLAPEDCLFSGKVIAHSREAFCHKEFPKVIAAMKAKGNTGYHMVANTLELETNVYAYYDYSPQTVQYSAGAGLLQSYIDLALPRLFVYGSANTHLSYLPTLESAHMELAMIPDSDHFLFYDNPKALYEVIAGFIGRHKPR